MQSSPAGDKLALEGAPVVGEQTVTFAAPFQKNMRQGRGRQRKGSKNFLKFVPRCVLGNMRDGALSSGVVSACWITSASEHDMVYVCAYIRPLVQTSVSQHVYGLSEKQKHKHKLFYFFWLFVYFVSASLPPRLYLVVRWALLQHGHTHGVKAQGVEDCSTV